MGPALSTEQLPAEQPVTDAVRHSDSESLVPPGGSAGQCVKWVFNDITLLVILFSPRCAFVRELSLVWALKQRKGKGLENSIKCFTHFLFFFATHPEPTN